MTNLVLHTPTKTGCKDRGCGAAVTAELSIRPRQQALGDEFESANCIPLTLPLRQNPRGSPSRSSCLTISVRIVAQRSTRTRPTPIHKPAPRRAPSPRPLADCASSPSSVCAFASSSAPQPGKAEMVMCCAEGRCKEREPWFTATASCIMARRGFLVLPRRNESAALHHASLSSDRPRSCKCIASMPRWSGKRSDPGKTTIRRSGARSSQA